MKLISFAVISLLAITVSAHPPLSTSTANDAPKCDKDIIKQKIRDLREAYPARIELVLKLGEPGEAEEKEQTIRSVMKDIKGQLKREDLLEGEKPKLEKHYDESVDDLEKAQSAVVAKKQQLKEASNQSYDIWMKVHILDENLDREAEQDARDKSKTGASSSLNPHRDILQEQINEGFQDANDLYMADQDILSGISKLDDVITRTKDPKKSKLYETWKKVMFTHQKLVREVGLSKGWGHCTEELQTEFGWPTQNSLALRMYQSYWQMPK
ncbi:hypothetical protein BASA50_002507 [Batrachochytrium salamandrivorans]|uniref:Uncharacterized protein n=1 Tax=Batrachochytrium salamandrivorans TaxID=1357716 RepID=A0ABQ8FL50_9FUNG|nr:hypothetical protein BASA62_002741 [Batrachochytrium salamandrivorans]KAH6582339.1 hypothetical protein BASA60_001979 [Batrachochytrium salamandrivorans]KAH6600182.1 hypothetical protein BASA50_002507 [Batrachochytrium salamandrivorans]KAH6602383.1 hypothetical protein BASA61_001171 [Batrachochytrium salamandrivorans]